MTKSIEAVNPTSSSANLCSNNHTPSSTNDKISPTMIDDQRDSVEADQIRADDNAADE